MLVVQDHVLCKSTVIKLLRLKPTDLYFLVLVFSRNYTEIKTVSVINYCLNLGQATDVYIISICLPLTTIKPADSLFKS